MVCTVQLFDSEASRCELDKQTSITRGALHIALIRDHCFAGSRRNSREDSFACAGPAHAWNKLPAPILCSYCNSRALQMVLDGDDDE